MKFIHLSDLHLGKRVNEYSMIEDQEYILDRIIEIIDAEAPDAIVIAGDVYDRSIPTAEAVMLLDSFISNIAERRITTLIISGNHDSQERIAFGSKLMEGSGVLFSRVYDGRLQHMSLCDAYGRVNFYMLPFIKPAHVKRFFENEIEDYTDAVRVALSVEDIDTSERNVLITHQFVTGSKRSESEEISVGGSDNVDVSVFEDFDYVALGHLHSPQFCSSQTVRYCGSPLKYSFSEANDKKSVTVVEMGEKGNTVIREIPLLPLRDLVRLRGDYNSLMLRSFYETTSYTTDYVHITLTDEEDVPDAIGRMRIIYKNLMKLDYDNTRTGAMGNIEALAEADEKTPIELFSALYEMQNNKPMTDEQIGIVEKIIEEVWEEEK